MFIYIIIIIITKMNETEAKMLIRLENVHDHLKTARFLAIKSNSNYTYIAKVLGEMKDKGWITSTKRGTKVFYQLTRKAPVEDAIALLGV